MPPSDISRQLAQIEAEMTLERTQRDNFLAREREELSFDAVADMHNDVCAHCSLLPSPHSCLLKPSRL
jgi:hypothetical protein